MTRDGQADAAPAGAGGRIYLETRPHAAAVAAELGRASAAVALCAGGAVWIAEAGVPLWRLPAGGLAALSAAAALRAVRSVWRWDRTTLAITGEAVLLTRRGVRRSTVRLPLATVERLTVAQSLPGRLLDYGTLQLRGDGANRGLRYVPRPAEVGALILRLRGRG